MNNSDLLYEENEQVLEGFVYNLDEKIYRDAEGISQSDIKTLVTDPYVYFHQIKVEQTKSMEEGILLHILLSYPERVGEQFFITNAERVTQSIKDEAGDLIIIKQKEFDLFRECVDQLKEFTKNNLALDLDLMDSEVSYFGEYEGIKAKGRADKLSKDGSTIIDFKKCQNASQREFTRTACNLKYGIQAVFYPELMGAENFGWIAIETKPLVDRFDKNHFMFGFFKPSQQMIDLGKRQIEQAFKILELREFYEKPLRMCEFMEDQVSPQIVQEIVPPLWHMQ